jgi:hypothetical protein
MAGRVAFASLFVFATAAPAQERAIGWGYYAFDSDVARTVPVAVSASDWCTTVLTADGRIFARGEDHGTFLVPPLATGRRYVQVAAGYVSVAIVDDGSLRQWGAYPGGFQAALPPLPPGVTATKVAAGRWFSAALLSNGEVRTWGVT